MNRASGKKLKLGKLKAGEPISSRKGRKGRKGGLGEWTSQVRQIVPEFGTFAARIVDPISDFRLPNWGADGAHGVTRPTN